MVLVGFTEAVTSVAVAAQEETEVKAVLGAVSAKVTVVSMVAVAQGWLVLELQVQSV